MGGEGMLKGADSAWTRICQVQWARETQARFSHGCIESCLVVKDLCGRRCTELGNGTIHSRASLSEPVQVGESSLGEESGDGVQPIGQR